MEVSNKFKYPVGECKSLHRDNEEIIVDTSSNVELIGYSWFNIQSIDTKAGTVRPTGEREKIPTCLKCFLYEKPMMEDRAAEKKIRHPGIIPYKWFYFYNEEDEKKYPYEWERRYEKLLAKEKVWKKYRGQKDLNTIVETPEWQKWLKDFKDCLSWDEKPTYEEQV